MTFLPVIKQLSHDRLHWGMREVPQALSEKLEECESFLSPGERLAIYSEMEVDSDEVPNLEELLRGLDQRALDQLTLDGLDELSMAAHEMFFKVISEWLRRHRQQHGKSE